MKQNELSYTDKLGRTLADAWRAFDALAAAHEQDKDAEELAVAIDLILSLAEHASRAYVTKSHALDRCYEGRVNSPRPHQSALPRLYAAVESRLARLTVPPPDPQHHVRSNRPPSPKQLSAVRTVARD